MAHYLDARFTTAPTAEHPAEAIPSEIYQVLLLAEHVGSKDMCAVCGEPFDHNDSCDLAGLIDLYGEMLGWPDKRPGT